MANHHGGGNEPNIKETAHWQTERRDRMAAEGLKTLLLLNGGGTVALLAFLEAIWKDASAIALIPWILAGMIFLVLGGAASGWTHFLRIEATFAYQFKGGDGRRATRTHNCVTYLAFIFFLFGIAVVIVGAVCNLPKLPVSSSAPAHVNQTKN